MLEITQRPIGLSMIAQGRAPRFDRFRQHVPNGAGELVRCGPRTAIGLDQIAGRTMGRQAGSVQGLADVDIAQSGDQLLVKQSRFQWSPLADE